MDPIARILARVQIDVYLAQQVGWSEADISKARGELYAMLRAAEAGDEQSIALMARFGVVVKREPREFAGETGEPSLQLPEGYELVTDPETGKRYAYRPGRWVESEEFGEPRWVNESWRSLGEVSPEAEGAPTARLRELQWLRDQGDMTEAQYRAELAKAFPGAGVTAPPTFASGGLRDLRFARDQGYISDAEYQQALRDQLMGTGEDVDLAREETRQRMDISRQRFGLEQQKAGRERQSLALTAARTGQPLTYLSWLSGAVPGAGGTDIYQGFPRLVPPAVSVGAPSAGGEGAEGVSAWRPPVAPQSQRTIQAGGVLGPQTFPAGLRAPGVLAEQNLTPFQREALGERVEFQGVPRMDWDDYLRRGRGSLGRGITPGGFGGKLSGVR